MRVEYPGAIYHVMGRGDRREDIFLVRKEDRLLAYPWSSLVSRLKNDPGKLATAARVRKETTLPIKWIAARLQMGTPKSVKPMLQHWIHAHEEPANHTTPRAMPCQQLQLQPPV